jgi:hypothetical protein
MHRCECKDYLPWAAEAHNKLIMQQVINFTAPYSINLFVASLGEVALAARSTYEIDPGAYRPPIS